MSTSTPTTDEASQLAIRSYRGIELGLGQADPVAEIAEKLSAAHPGHLVLVQAGKFLHGYDAGVAPAGRAEEARRLTPAWRRRHHPDVAEKEATGIDLLNWSGQKPHSVCHAAFLRLGVSSNGRPGGRSRKARRCSNGKVNSRFGRPPRLTSGSAVQDRNWSTAMTALTLGTSEIRQLDGLYSLNDLHAAAGGEDKHKPANFLRLDQTQALIAEIQCSEMSTAAKTINGGPRRGTYVCRELVYAYANWISPAFYLKMIRAFDAMQKPAAAADPAAIDLRAVMLAGNSTPAVPLPADVQTAINRKAWAMAHDAYELCRESLARRVAWRAEVGNPRHIDTARALAAIAETTLGMALAPEHFNKVRGLLMTMEAAADIVRDHAAKVREELKGQGILE